MAAIVCNGSSLQYGDTFRSRGTFCLTVCTDISRILVAAIVGPLMIQKVVIHMFYFMISHSDDWWRWPTTLQSIEHALEP